MSPNDSRPYRSCTCVSVAWPPKRAHTNRSVVKDHHCASKLRATGERPNPDVDIVRCAPNRSQYGFHKSLTWLVVLFKPRACASMATTSELEDVRGEVEGLIHWEDALEGHKSIISHEAH